MTVDDTMSLDPTPSARELRAMAAARGVAVGAVAPPKREHASLTLTLPLPPNMSNGRRHWRAKDRERKAYCETCDEWQNSSVIPPPPARPFGHTEVTATLTLWNPMDDDNAMARLKWAVDWLVTRGYLAGDSRAHLRWLAMPDQRVSRKEPPSVTFHLSPIRR